ncbi:MAG: glycoside hydrolase family 3 C-terminal domain-containing protein, partial [Anaerolineae bacterium]|nr:glycoside hydrolase family 3 C-terminal domain-containing protein [Anaerolineae bacterium]
MKGIILNMQSKSPIISSNPPPPGDIKDKVSYLLSQMNLEEKIGQMVQADLTWKQDIPQLLREGRVGALLTVHDPAVINRLQHIAVEESRLGIPLLVGNDIIHGYRTIFPIPLALAGSWDMDLIERVAAASIAEAVSAGTNWNYAPMVDISRDPRWGRVAESAGEDPLLSSQVARAWVRGYQNYRDADGRRAAACVKHFAAYGAAEAGKDYNTVDMSERRLREEYLPPYRAAIQAGVESVMTSFNDFNGQPATANTFLLQQILRKEWGFEGLIVSDFDSVGELVLHGFARDHKEAALRSMLAGIDMDMMSNAYHFYLTDLVREGKVPLELIDASVRRILTLKFNLGLFEHPYVDEKACQQAMFLPAALQLAEKAAEESMVLLKNESGLLPLAAGGTRYALIGPLANERTSLMGCWSFDGRPEEVETLKEALQKQLPAGSRLTYAQGCSLNGETLALESALAAAEQADVILLALGEEHTLSGEAHSRAHLGLPGRQMELFNALQNTGKPVITLLFCGRPLAIPELVEKSASLLLAWHGGTCTARALCNLLTGQSVPSGRLPVSFPRSVGQIPLYYAHKRTGRPADTSGTLQFNSAHRSIYLDENNAPLFPFGFGLSYSQVEYSDLQLNPLNITAEGQ